MRRLRAGIDGLLGWVICLLMAAMAVNVLWQVFTRFVLRSPSSFTEEAARYMMIGVGLLGSAYAVGNKSHLALDLTPAVLIFTPILLPVTKFGMTPLHFGLVLIFIFASGFAHLRSAIVCLSAVA